MSEPLQTGQQKSPRGPQSFAAPDDIFWAGVKATAELAAKYGINPTGPPAVPEVTTTSQSLVTKKWIDGIQKITKDAGLDCIVELAIGDWHKAEGTPGYEPAAAIHVQGARDFDQIKYASALLGLGAQQIVMLPFKYGDGPDAAWEFEVEDRLPDVRGVLERYDLPYRALIPKGHAKTKVILIDFGDRKTGAVRDLARLYRVRPTWRAGRGELFGFLKGREAAAAARAARHSADRQGTARTTAGGDTIWCDTGSSPVGSGIILLLGRKPSETSP